MKTIACSNPQTILNPHLPYLLLCHRAYHTPDGDFFLSDFTLNRYFAEFPYSTFSPRRLRTANIEDYYVFNPDTGETFPMYYKVPCGNCIICREKKSNEWAFRAICEAQYSQTIPVFITLTFEDKYLPEGKCVSVRDLQLFLKRFRINLERAGHPCNIRYFGVGEYGSNFGRPHYHLQVFRLPFIDMRELLEIVRKSWKFGFVQVKLCHENSTRYIMKYMRKDCSTTNGRTEPFFLASRKDGGLGIDWCQEMREWFRRHPDSACSVTDKWSGQTVTQAMPQYFRDKIFPTLSKLLTKELRDNFKLYNWICNIRLTCEQHQTDEKPEYEPITQFLRMKFGMLPWYEYTSPDEDICNLLRKHQDMYYGTVFLKSRLEQSLKDYELDTAYIMKQLDITQSYKNIQSYKASFLNITDEWICAKEDAIKHRRLLQKKREVF